MSKNKGRTWKSISKNLPEDALCWRIIQDHVDENLFFLGTEFGVYFTNKKTKAWTKFSSGLPNISIRDIAIQKRENDLILGTFGRGIYILDDYSSLRNFNISNIETEAKLFAPRDSYWYKQKRTLGGRKKASQGDNYFVAENPPYGVEFTYFLQDKYISKKGKRKKEEKKLEKENLEVTVPDWNILEDEKKELKPTIYLFIYSDNKIIRKVKAQNKKGFNRVSWDLYSESKGTITQKNQNRDATGFMLSPGEYTAQLFKQIDGEFTAISSVEKFKLKRLRSGALENVSDEIKIDYAAKVYNLRNKGNELSNNIKELKNNISLMLKSYERAESTNPDLLSEILNLRSEAIDLEQKIGGSKVRKEIGEDYEYPTMWTYLWSASGGTNSSYGPTNSHTKSLASANQIFINITSEFEELNNRYSTIPSKLKLIGAPKIED